MEKQVEKIYTERLILRGIDETDTEEIVSWRSDPEVYKYFKRPHRITPEEHIHWYRNNYLCNPDRFDWMCIEKSSGNKIGVFGLAADGDNVEINYLLASEAQHKGYAYESVKRLIRYAKEKMNAKKIIALVNTENLPSAAVAEKAGMKPESRDEIFIRYVIEVI